MFYFWTVVFYILSDKLSNMKRKSTLVIHVSSENCVYSYGADYFLPRFDLSSLQEKKYGFCMETATGSHIEWG